MSLSPVNCRPESVIIVGNPVMYAGQLLPHSMIVMLSFGHGWVFKNSLTATQ